jgi:hypothetical protein
MTTGKLIKKSEIIESLFFRLGTEIDDQADALTMLKDIKELTFESICEAHINNDTRNIGPLSLCLEHLLSYRHGVLVDTKEVFQAIFEIIALF